jgi:hypothetical protein
LPSHEIFLLLAFVAACGNDSSVVEPLAPVDARMSAFRDADDDSDSRAKFTPWSAPVNLGPVINSPADEIAAEISQDGLTLYFASNRPGAPVLNDIYVSTRDCRDTTNPRCEWKPPVNVASLNTPHREAGAHVLGDGRRVLITSNRPGGHGGNDLYIALRDDVQDPHAWATPTNLGSPVNSADGDFGPSTWKREMYFWRGPATSPTAMPGDLFVSRIHGSEFGPPRLVAELRVEKNPATADLYHDEKPAVRYDGREILFASNRPNSASMDIWTSLRRSARKPWGLPANAGSVVNSASNERRPSLSPDGTMLFFDSDRAGGRGGTDLYVSVRRRIRD